MHPLVRRAAQIVREIAVYALAIFLMLAVAAYRLSVQAVWYHCFVKRRLRQLLQPPPVRRDLENGRTAFLSPSAHPSLGESALAIARKLRTGEYTSREVTAAYLEQARRVNRVLNAAVNFREPEALKEASAADARLAAARKLPGKILPPFLGVPCSVKEAIACEGFPLTSGLVARKDCAPCLEDATAVARLRAAGFVVLCQTNVSELCMWLESSNLVYGRTNNAYDPHRMVGGSSGGEGALLSACGAPVGLGADVGGSIRMPAAFNGVFGHKPTGGLIPNTGQYPYTKYPFLTTGPLALAASDLWTLVELLRGADGLDPACVPIEPVQVALPLGERVVPTRLTPWPRVSSGTAAAHGAAAGVAASGEDGATAVTAAGSVIGVDGLLRPPVLRWASVTVFTLAHPERDRPRLSSAVEPDIAAAVGRAAAVLTSPLFGCGSAVLELPELVDAFDMWSAVLGDADQPSFRQLLEAAHGPRPDGSPLHLGEELVRWALGLSEHTVPAIVLALIEEYPRLMPRRRLALLESVRSLRARLHATLAAANGVLLLPVHPVTAPLHDTPWLVPHNVGYTGLFNVLETPVTVVPMGLDHRLVPVAIQVVGARGFDALTCAVAEALEATPEAGGGWVPPRLAYGL